MVNVAVIPARGASRLENKNLYSLDGKPLIRWITQTVVNSNLFDIIIISTDTDSVYYAVSDLQVQKFDSKYEDDIDNVIAIASTFDLEIGDTFSYFSSLFPFVSIDDIKKGFNLFSNSDVDSVVGVCKMVDSIQSACLISPEKYVIPIFSHPEDGMIYYKFCSFSICKAKSFLNNKKFITDNTKCVVIPEKRSFEISSVQDILYAESFINRSI